MLRISKISSHLAYAFCVAKKFKYSFKYGSSILPHPEKEFKGGEDALLVSKNVLMVADGVGGWADKGIDPGLYSKRLVKIVEELVSQDPELINDPK
jgi:protein phosphatase PTC7